eukprot:1804532-Rhodomonas_salina.6
MDTSTGCSSPMPALTRHSTELRDFQKVAAHAVLPTAERGVTSAEVNPSPITVIKPSMPVGDGDAGAVLGTASSTRCWSYVKACGQVPTCPHTHVRSHSVMKSERNRRALSRN